ncbi:hypothetical protein [Clostridium brassicae]|uniref:Uncharacterized protein n=1 Tax=Clostridium brassicae TaxID=2999072 RepID=A0ABT4DBY8_9CLOT|nr:hypothetical protein [Clostridium brassicae]MCY6958549.1 hypothetical protein [Clostridium brassicae]
MNFKVKEVRLHGNKKLSIYIPIEVPKQLTAIDPLVGDKSVLANSIAYKFLRKLFILASSLNFQEIIYIPTNSIALNEYRDIFKYGIFDMDIVLVNYHATQLKSKEILKAIKMKRGFTEYFKEIFVEDNNLIYPDYWLTDQKLSTKRLKNILIISTNRDVFLKFACDVDSMIETEDSEQYNFDYHLHEDFIGTSKDNGFNFLYYHRKENS